MSKNQEHTCTGSGQSQGAESQLNPAQIHCHLDHVSDLAQLIFF